MKIRSLMLIAACGLAGTDCGSSSSPADPTPSATPAPTPTATPVATPPQHQPTPPPCNDCEPPVTNTNPPVRLTLRVYKVQDESGQIVPGIPPSIPVGYTVTVDATPKDKDNRDTLGSGTVEFTFSDLNLVDVSSNHGFQKKLKVLAPGLLEVKGSLDGVESDTLVIVLG